VRRPAAYALSLLVLAAAILLRWLLDRVMGDSLPLVTLFGAVAAAVWVGGYLTASVITILGYAACNYLFIAPRGAFAFDAESLVGLTAYLFTSALIIAIGEAMRRAQARASARGEVLRVTLGSIGDAVITTDIEGRVTYLNRVAESLTGWSHQDALEQPLAEVFRIINEDTRRPVESPATRALRQGIVVGLANHTLLVGKDGVERPIDDSAAPIRDDNGVVSGCVLIFRDVSERRQWEKREAARMLSARLLASIVESSDDAIISKTLDGVIQSWNAAAERLFGYTSSEAIGRHISLVIPPDRIAEEDHIIATLKAGTRIEHFETERMRKDGQRILVSLTVSPIKDDDSRVVGASKIARDISAQKLAESERQNAGREQHRLHRHLRPQCRAHLREPRRPADGRTREHGGGSARQRPRLLLPRGSVTDDGRVLSIGRGTRSRRDRGSLQALQDRTGALDGLQSAEAR
jgi:PAS domain S-box-containing protein